MYVSEYGSNDVRIISAISFNNQPMDTIITSFGGAFLVNPFVAIGNNIGTLYVSDTNNLFE